MMFVRRLSRLFTVNDRNAKPIMTNFGGTLAHRKGSVREESNNMQEATAPRS
jgi:hypothetical protein